MTITADALAPNPLYRILAPTSDMFKLPIGTHCTAPHLPIDMFIRVHYEACTVCNWAVGILLECVLVVTVFKSYPNLNTYFLQVFKITFSNLLDILDIKPLLPPKVQLIPTRAKPLLLIFSHVCPFIHKNLFEAIEPLF